jgi:hypothetical protein
MHTLLYVKIKKNWCTHCPWAHGHSSGTEKPPALWYFSQPPTILLLHVSQKKAYSSYMVYIQGAWRLLLHRIHAGGPDVSGGPGQPPRLPAPRAGPGYNTSGSQIVNEWQRDETHQICRSPASSLLIKKTCCNKQLEFSWHDLKRWKIATGNM